MALPHQHLYSTVENPHNIQTTQQCKKASSYLVDVAFIVVHVEYAVKLSVTAHSELALSAQTRRTVPG